MQLWDHQAQEVPLLLEGHRALWWEPGTGKTAPLAVAGRDTGLAQLWLTLSQGGMLPLETGRKIADVRGDKPRVQVVTTGSVQIDSRADVVVCSYSLVTRKPIWQQLARRQWGSLVLDEAHALANTGSDRTRAVYGAKRDSAGALYRSAGLVWPATGTPVLNNPMDLWPHVSRLWPDIALPTKQAWEDEYCVTRRTDYGMQVVGGRNLEQLQAQLTRHSSRYLLTDVARDLPGLTIDEMEVEVTPADRRAIEAEMSPEQLRELAAVLAEIEGGDAAMEARLQALMLPLAGVRRVTALMKAKPVASRVADELRGGLDRVIVFGIHRDALAQACQLLQLFGAALLNGDTPARDRQRHLAAFEAGTCRALIMNTQVGGTGLDLQHCRRQVFLEANWAPGANQQPIARCYRAGQRRPVHVSFAAIRRSVDQTVQQVLLRKQRIINAILGDEK